jgi:hypothetical protein
MSPKHETPALWRRGLKEELDYDRVYMHSLRMRGKN